MTRIIFICILFISSLGFTQTRVSIIPKPVSLIQTKEGFVIDPQTSIRFNKKDKDIKAAAQFLSSYIESISGYVLPLNKKAGNSIQLIIEKTEEIGDEGYLLNVTAESVRIIANTKAGIVYGMQSLFQTLPQIRSNAPLIVPGMVIKDYPRFGWRGMHLDVSRHFFSPDVIKAYIDLMAAYKFNIFHWHLTDTQGWRLQIRQYPKLTSVGAWRVDRTGVPFREIKPAKEGEPATYGGYYTRLQVKDIVKYAMDRNITIVPEIEMPGHSQAAIASYPFLSCIQKPQLVLPGRGTPDHQLNLCAGNDSVFNFMENVLSEVFDMFPSKYIHIGGDEVNKSAWERCPKCQQRIKSEGLKNEDELQSYFITRIGKFLTKHNRKLIGWDEILEGGLAPGAAVMSWRGEKGGIEAAKQHHNVVMSPGTPLYFDKFQRGPAGEPGAIGGFNTLKMIYDYDPVPKELNDAESKFIIGAQANLWTEFISTVQHLEYMVLPRMLALSEVVWSPKENKDWGDFDQRLDYHFRAFDQKGINYSLKNYTIAVRSSSEKGVLAVSLSSDIPGAEIYYTTDGKIPTPESQKYRQAIIIKSSSTVKAILTLNGKILSSAPLERAFNVN